MEPHEILERAAEELQADPLSERKIHAQLVLSNVRLYVQFRNVYWRFRNRNGSAVERLIWFLEGKKNA